MQKRVLVAGSTAILLVSLIIVAVATSLSSRGNVSHAKDNSSLLNDCIKTVITDVEYKKLDFPIYRDVWSLCGNQIYNNDFLEDFDIRKEKLIRQELDERVILWMVVSITTSGVGLAGLQLLASYRLASTSHMALSHDSDLSIEAGKLSLKSSVTGLFVLALSLAFFIVYVKWVYLMSDINLEKPISLPTVMQKSTGLPNSPTGKFLGYGDLPPSTTALQSGAAILRPQTSK